MNVLCVHTSIGFAPPGVVAGHLAVSPLRQSSVKAALGLTVKISLLGHKRNKRHNHRSALRFHDAELKQLIVGL